MYKNKNADGIFTRRKYFRHDKKEANYLLDYYVFLFSRIYN